MNQTIAKQAVTLLAALGAAFAAQAEGGMSSTAESRPQSQMQNAQTQTQDGKTMDSMKNADPGHQTPSSTTDRRSGGMSDRYENAPPTSAGAASDAASEPMHRKNHKHKAKRHGHAASDAASVPNRASHSGGSASAPMH